MTYEMKQSETAWKEKIAQLEKDVDELRKRPVGTSTGPAVEIDTSNFATKMDLDALQELTKKCEIRNLEQDERLTNNELRLGELERMINDPLARIEALEEKVNNLSFMMNNKVNSQDYYQDLRKKADINDLKALEASLIRLNELINDL